MSSFLCKLILYGYVYDVDYSYLRNYNTELGRISSNLNQIAKRVNSTGNIYQEDIDEVKELMNVVQIAIEPESSPAGLIPDNGNRPMHLDNSHTIEIEADGLLIRMSNEIKPLRYEVSLHLEVSS